MKKTILLFALVPFLIINYLRHSESYIQKTTVAAIDNGVGSFQIPLPFPEEKNKIEIKGMSLVAPMKELKRSTFVELKANHVNSVSLIPYAFVNIEEASVTYNFNKQWWGESKEGIIASTRMAHEFKMSVMLKPHLWIHHSFYTGDLNFSSEKNWKHWEADHEKYILDFAKIAAQEKIEFFCFGTELRNSVAKRPEYWNQLIAKIRKIYNGKLTYAANWDDYQKVPFWNQLDYVGIDAYFPLSDAEEPSVKKLNESWKNHTQKIDKFQKKINKKIILTEFGYRNSSYTTEAPWSETKNTLNNQAQASAYESLFQSFTKQDWFLGGYAWKWYADDYHQKTKTGIDFTPQDKPALGIIKNWYE